MATTRGSTLSLARRSSLISTACSWCGIIICANVSSAALKDADAVGALVMPGEPPMSVPSIPDDPPLVHALRVMAVATAAAARRYLRILGIVFPFIVISKKPSRRLVQRSHASKDWRVG